MNYIYLLSHFFMTISSSDQFIIGIITRTSFSLHDQSLKSFFKKILKILKLLLIISKTNIEKLLILAKKHPKLSIILLALLIYLNKIQYK